MADDDTDLGSGNLRFVDYFLPLLEAGDYQIIAEHSVQIKGEATSNFNSAQSFSVQAPRFRLDANDIHSISPPNNSAGKYETQLPHIVFNKRTLPWEHELQSLQDRHGLPWMALLILDAEDISTSATDGQRTPCLGMMCKLKEAVDLCDGAQNSTGDLSNSNSKVCKPKISSLYVGQTEDDPVEVIQIKRDRLLSFLPHTDELRLLAHARQVSMEHREILPLDHSGWFSVLVANRFPSDPQAPALQYAHVVSLEGLEEYLSPTLTTEDPDLSVQLISLYSWSFTCLPDHGESFSRFMLRLSAAGLNNNGQGLLLRFTGYPQSIPQHDSPSAVIVDNLLRGYLPLPYQDDHGNRSLCWYRGPAIPIKEKAFTRIEGARVFNRAEDAMLLHPETGLYDLTYSVAWQTGRLLALANRAFSINLMDWRKKVNHLLWVLANLEDHDLSETIGQSLIVGIQNTLVSDAFISYLLKDFVQQLTNNEDINMEHTPTSSTQPPDISTQGGDSRSALDKIQDLLTKQEITQILYSIETHDALRISEFLARWSLLYDVPFEQIVPDPEMLPPESIRFFYLDQAWIDSMMDGALSIGIQSSKSRLHTDNSRTLFRGVVDRLVQQYRRSLLNLPETATDSTDEGISGFLLRSEILSQFPGLQIKAYQNDQKTLLSPLRFDRLSPSVLLCLYPGSPAWIEFDEPHENVCFGILDESTQYVLKLRNLKDGTIIPDKTILVDDSLYRSRKDRILNIERLGNAIASGLGYQKPIGSSIFALQMVKVTEKLVFQPPKVE